jgi:hypothetical protein
MMSSVDVQSLIEEYTRWLRSGITVAQVGDAHEITTPFLDRHNDHIQIYVRQEGGRTVLSDDGYVIADLRQNGCLLDSEHRTRLLSSILNGFGVRRDGDELVTISHNGDFPQRKHAMVQAMLAVGDLFATAQSHVKSLFLEDVSEYLEQIGARAFADFQLVGKSGFQHKFDFALSKSPTAPERLIRAVNKPSKDNALLVIAAWSDVRSSRSSDAQMYTVLNDSDNSVPGEVVDALTQYDIVPVLWSQRMDHKAQLAA